MEPINAPSAPYSSVANLQAFVDHKAALFPHIVAQYALACAQHNVRLDYAVFNALHLTDYFHNQKAKSYDFGAIGKVFFSPSDGIEAHVVGLASLGDFLNLPALEFEGIKKIAFEFRSYMGIQDVPPDVVQAPPLKALEPGTTKEPTLEKPHLKFPWWFPQSIALRVLKDALVFGTGILIPHLPFVGPIATYIFNHWDLISQWVRSTF